MTMNRQREDTLVGRLAYNRGDEYATAIDRGTAIQILRNPQAHIDALVEAGVLEKFWVPTGMGGKNPGDWAYTVVVQPHVHEWRIATDDEFRVSPEEVYISCRGCNQFIMHPNHLPIEVPDD